MDMKLEVVTIPVSDVDRATKFYASLGWRQDVTPPGVVQFTPPGSSASIQFGPDRTSAPPGSAENLFLIVPDVKAVHDELVAAGIEVDGFFHRTADGFDGGLDPERRSYLSYTSFSDPDGNRWLLQEITTRLPGRVEDSATTFGSTSDLASAMKRAGVAHGEHERRVGEPDPNWPAWYAEYMAREQNGAELPT